MAENNIKDSHSLVKAEEPESDYDSYSEDLEKNSENFYGNKWKDNLQKHISQFKKKSKSLMEIVYEESSQDENESKPKKQNQKDDTKDAVDSCKGYISHLDIQETENLEILKKRFTSKGLGAFDTNLEADLDNQEENFDFEDLEKENQKPDADKNEGAEERDPLQIMVDKKRELKRKFDLEYDKEKGNAEFDNDFDRIKDDLAKKSEEAAKEFQGIEEEKRVLFEGFR